MKRLALIALCVLCMGASARKPGVYTVTVAIDTTYVKTGATEDGVPLFRQRIDTTETWVLQGPWDSLDIINIWRTLPTLDSVTIIDVPLGSVADTSRVVEW